MDKAIQLRDALGRLAPREAVALARAVELQRLLGKEELPTDLVLEALRPRLREARAARIPTLCRVACRAFDGFLTDREDDPRLSGLIARAALRPWWRAMRRLGGDALKAFEQKLRAIQAEAEPGSVEELALEAQKAALGWTQQLLAELRKPKGDAALRALFPTPLLQADLREMAALLAVAEPLGQVLAALQGNMTMAPDGQTILELTPHAVTLAKQHYQALAEAHGMSARFLPLWLLNRLAQPWHILRLGRALSWKPDDSLVRDTEFGVVGERLIHDLQRVAKDIVATVSRRAQLPDRAALLAALSRYMEEAEGLVGELGFRRDSPWGEAILRTRMDLSGALDRDFLDRMAEQAILGKLMPLERRSGTARGLSAEPDLRAAPEAAAIEEAEATAQFLIALLLRGARHGFAQAARACIDGLGEEIDTRAGTLLDTLRQAPQNRVAEAQLHAAARILDVLFDDGRGALLTRRMRIAAHPAG